MEEGYDGGVLVHGDLQEALEVAQLEGERVRHHDVGCLTERCRGEGFPLGVDDLATRWCEHPR